MPTERFEGFSPAALRFLRDLAKHNDRDWFAPRKELFERELQAPLRALAADATAALRKAGSRIAADPTRPTFRIYRDVRFSADKRPYKTNVGTYLPPGGRRDAQGGLYVHIEPGECFVCVAYHQLDKDELRRWRDAIAKDTPRFSAMLRALERNGVELSDDHHALKRVPRGYEAFAGTPSEKYFKYGSFVVAEDLKDADVMKRSLIDRMVKLASRAKPLIDFGERLS
jgi:uncharacterized protein (TIGR02453 family)